jgi:hypothetical protein
MTEIFMHQFNDVVCGKTVHTSIGLRQISDARLLADVIRYLWGGKPGMEFPTDKIWETSDSILQIPLWIGFCEAPRCIYLQLATHRKKDFFYPWCASARPDRDAKAASEYSRMQPLKFVMVFSSKAAIEISHLRLCMKAEAYTRQFVFNWKVALETMGDKASAMTARQMMPMCAFRNGLCTELHGCKNPHQYSEYVRKVEANK